jgi:hypothetical protein
MELARSDFEAFVAEMGIPRDALEALVRNDVDLVPMPVGVWNLRTGPSEIEGTGTFVVRDAVQDELLAPMNHELRRTPAGRYTNHSPVPNARMVSDGDQLNLVALSFIAAGTEVTIDYRQAYQERGTDHRWALRSDLVGDEMRALYLAHDAAGIRRAIAIMVEQMLVSPDRIEMQVEHEFVDGMYVRRLRIPKHTLLVGKVHRKDCINVVAEGDITVLTEFGVKRLKPGLAGISAAGIQKVGWTHEDTVFVNIFRTDALDLEGIEEEIAFAPTGDLLELACQ